MKTALLVLNWSAVNDATGFVAALSWFLPTVIGSPVIARASSQVAKDRRPRSGPEGRRGRPVSCEQPARP